jgi:hypothetical protein
MERTVKRAGRRSKWKAATVVSLLLAWLFLGHILTWRRGNEVAFDWNTKVGFRDFDACPRISKLARIVTAPYCLLIEVQARFFIAREFRKYGWEDAKGRIDLKMASFLPIVVGLDRLADWHIVDPKVTPLMDAAEKGDVALVKQLLAGGANVNAHDQRGYTALMHASMGRRDAADVVRVLLSAGAIVNARDKSGRSALIWSMRNEMRSGIVKELVLGGADVNIRDSYGTSALLEVISSGQDEIAEEETVNLLIAAGADLEAKNSLGETPWDLAMRTHRVRIAEMLNKAGAKQSHSKYE